MCLLFGMTVSLLSLCYVAWNPFPCNFLWIIFISGKNFTFLQVSCKWNSKWSFLIFTEIYLQLTYIFNRVLQKVILCPNLLYINQSWYRNMDKTNSFIYLLLMKQNQDMSLSLFIALQSLNFTTWHDKHTKNFHFKHKNFRYSQNKIILK